MDFQIKPLQPETFAHLFELSDEELARQQACRHIVTETPGTPCRVSMQDADVGETVILVNYQHQPADSPYQSTHAVFVRENAEPAQLGINDVPDVIRSRLISLRFFDQNHMMIDAEVVEGDAITGELSKAFDRDDIAYAHIHNAKPGCFAASVHKVSSKGKD